ncbi:MAG: YfbU family protein [Anaerolineae bacterium]|nr:YfbU family protein [Anaerolineae bacterium]
MKLIHIERSVLFNQFAILEKLDPDLAPIYRRYQEFLEKYNRQYTCMAEFEYQSLVDKIISLSDSAQSKDNE